MKKWTLIDLLIFIIFALFITVAVTFPRRFSKTFTFQKTIGGLNLDRGIDVKQTSDGGYIAVGVTNSYGAGGEDIFLVRTDSKGDTIWTRTFGGEKRDNGWAISTTSDGGFIVAGFTENNKRGDMDFLAIRTDSEGNLLWRRTYGGDGDQYCWDMDIVKGGGFVLLGETGAAGQYNEGDKDFYLVRIAENGEVIWEKTYGGADTDRGFAVRSTHDDGFIMIGSTKTYGAGDVDAFVIKTDSNGKMDWAKSFGTEAFDMGHDVQQQQDGGYVCFGYTESFEAQDRDLWFLCLDTEGNKTWSRVVGGSNADQGTRGVLTADGDVVLLGYTKSYGAGHWDVYLVKVTVCGDTVWTRTFGSPWPDTGYGISLTADGGFVLTGQTWSNGRGDSDLFLMKTDEKGWLIDNPEGQK